MHQAKLTWKKLNLLYQFEDFRDQDQISIRFRGSAMMDDYGEDREDQQWHYKCLSSYQIVQTFDLCKSAKW